MRGYLLEVGGLFLALIILGFLARLRLRWLA